MAYTDEAKAILQDYVLPVLPVLKRVNLITGRGKHSQNGVSVLKESVKKFLCEDVGVPLRCEDRMDNEGVLFVSV
jgi:DNA-nicking Smr family endonuclease